MTHAAADPLRSSRERIKTFQGAHLGQRAVIVGNGPSLNKMDLSFLKREVTFGMNRIYLGFEKYDFTPTYYVSVNDLVLQQSMKDILEIKAPRFLSARALEYVESQDAAIFLSSLDAPLFSRDPGKGIWEGYTVTYVALQLAYYMGFNEVYLIGVDHHFHSPGKPNEEVVASGEDVNHFDPAYFGEGVRWHLPDLTNSEYAYSLARDVFLSEGRCVYDATVDGKLDIFQKIDYRRVFFDGKSPSEGKRTSRTPPLVSILPGGNTLNVSLDDVLETFSHQTYPNVELLLPEKATREPSRTLREGWSQCRVSVDQLNPQQGRAKLLENASGDFVTFIDPGASYHPDHLSILAGKLDSDPACPAVFTQLDDTASNSPPSIPAVPSLRIGDDVTVESLLILNPIDRRSLMLRTAALLSAGNLQPDHGTTAVWDACIRLAADRPIARLNTVTVHALHELPAPAPEDQRALYQRHRSAANGEVIAAQEEILQSAESASQAPNRTHWSSAIMSIVVRADEAIARQDYALAVTLLASAKQSYPDDAFLLNAHGNLVLLMGNAEAAREDFERAVIVDPSSAESHIGLGMALLQLGHIPEGLEVIEQAAVLDPDNPTVRMIKNEFGTTVNSAQERIIHPQAISK